MDLKLTNKDIEILNTPYSREGVRREEVDLFPIAQRGSVRLTAGGYFTEEEYRAFIEEGLKSRLPGQPGFRRQQAFSWVKRMLSKAGL